MANPYQMQYPMGVNMGGVGGAIGGVPLAAPKPAAAPKFDVNAQLAAILGQQGGGQSVADLQGQRAMGQGLAQQQAMAASARGNPGTAQMLAAQNAGKIVTGVADATQMARLQEEEQKRQAMIQALLQMRGQDMGLEQAKIGQPSTGDKLLGIGSGIASAALMASDRRLKTDIRDGDADADAFIEAIRPKTWRYKDGAKFGDGDRVGVMAQDIERAKMAKHAVIDTPDGKMIDTRLIAGPALAAIGRLGRKVAALEAKRKAG